MREPTLGRKPIVALRAALAPASATTGRRNSAVLRRYAKAATVCRALGRVESARTVARHSPATAQARAAKTAKSRL